MGLLYIRGSLLSASWIVIAVQALAVALMIWARITFGFRSFHATAEPTEGRLVTEGPYRFVRNPIYAAVLMFAWAGIFAHPSWESFLLGMAIAVGTGLRLFSEEAMLRERYPEYAAYANKTRRIIPYIF